MRRCAFLTLEDPTGYVIDDELAYPPLAARGWEVTAVPWQRAAVPWPSYDAVVIRSTWDYLAAPEAFLARLGEIDGSGPLLLNSLDLVRWNLRKTYLRDLAAAGVLIVPTLWREQLRAEELPELFEKVGSAEIVIKPVIGLNACGAYRLDRGTVRSRAEEVGAYYAERALLAQPFLSAVATEGEYSLFYFNGTLSHAIVKQPKNGDFRVQEEHGGTLRAIAADEPLRAAGERVLRGLRSVPLYARADFVRANGADDYLLMELELIEPSLYLRMDAGAPERFARALHERVPAAAQ